MTNSTLHWTSKNQHIIDYHFDLLGLLKIKKPRNLTLTFNIDKSYSPYFKKYIIVQPCSGSKIKEWKIINWINLCNYFNKKNINIIFCGSTQREEEVCEKIINAIHDPKLCLNLANKLKWFEYLSLIKKSIFLIGVDSLGGHLASSMNKYSITIKTGINNDILWKPYNRNLLLRFPTECYPCNLNKGCASMDCINNLTISRCILDIKKFCKSKKIELNI